MSTRASRFLLFVNNQIVATFVLTPGAAGLHQLAAPPTVLATVPNCLVAYRFLRPDVWGKTLRRQRYVSPEKSHS
jgi:hypothetical protein